MNVDQSYVIGSPFRCEQRIWVGAREVHKNLSTWGKLGADILCRMRELGAG